MNEETHKVKRQSFLLPNQFMMMTSNIYLNEKNKTEQANRNTQYGWYIDSYVYFLVCTHVFFFFLSCCCCCFWSLSWQKLQRLYWIRLGFSRDGKYQLSTMHFFLFSLFQVKKVFSSFVSFSSSFLHAFCWMERRARYLTCLLRQPHRHQHLPNQWLRHQWHHR